jgi:hypothetical protein
MIRQRSSVRQKNGRRSKLCRPPVALDMVYGLTKTGTRRDFVAIRYVKGNSRAGTRAVGNCVGLGVEGWHGGMGTGWFRWRCQLLVDPTILLFSCILYFLFYPYIYIFSFFVRHLPRVNRFDQSRFAVILRQLLVFTTLHAPHFLPPFLPGL